MPEPLIVTGIISTSSGENRDFIMSLGADEHIDYRAQKFEIKTPRFENLPVRELGGCPAPDRIRPNRGQDRCHSVRKLCPNRATNREIGPPDKTR